MATDLTKDQKIARQSSELKTLQDDQRAELAAGKTPMVEANRNSKYMVKERESKKYIHVLVIERTLDSTQTEFINNERIIPVRVREFDNRVKAGAFSTYFSAEVIHDPRPGVTGYNLKPSNLNKDSHAATVQDRVDGGSKKQMESIEREKQNLSKAAQVIEDKAKEVEGKAKEVDTKIAEVDQKEKTLAQREQELNAREQRLNEQQKKLDTPTVNAASGAGPADMKVADANTSTATTPKK